MTNTGISQNIETSIKENILKIVLNRPDKKNAISKTMYKAMATAITQAENDAEVRAIFIRGTEDCFTSGNDLTDFVAAANGRQESPAMEFLQNISAARKPIVAAVNGPAVGIGTTLLLHCDLIYAGQSAKFRLPFVNLGLCPEAACSYLLPRLSGYQKAAELLFLGEFFSAQEAAAFGLVSEVFDDDELYQMAWVQALKLAAQPPDSLMLTKALLKRTTAKDVAETMHLEVGHFGERLKTAEAQEAFAAFFKKS
jgi:enoyl-CoA hydratase/carnithine racemase